MNPFIRYTTTLLLLLNPTIHALSFSLTQTNQCEKPVVSWSDARGGDLTLLIVPTKHGDHHVVQTFTIPSTSSSPFTIDESFLLPTGSEFIATMWDEAGLSDTFTTGIMTTGSGPSSSCLIPPSNPYVDFFFDFSTFTPSQCSSLSITWDSNYTAPLRAIALTPGTSSSNTSMSMSTSSAQVTTGINEAKVWELYETANQGTSGFDWKVDVKEGEEFVMVILDNGPFGNGGSSELITVGSSSDSSCLVQTGSSTKTVVATDSGSGRTVLQTIIQVVTQSASTESAEGSKRSSVPIGALVGGLVSGLLVLVLVALFLLWRHRRKQVRDPDHPRQSTWKPYRETTVFLGGIAPCSRGGDATRRDTGTGRSSPDLGQPFLASPGQETASLGKLTPGEQSLVESDYGFLPAIRETEQQSMGFEQDEELSPYLMPRETLGSSSPRTPSGPMMRSLGHVSRGSPALSTMSANVGEKQGRLGVRNPDTLEEEDTFETIGSEIEGTVSPLPSRLAGTPLQSSSSPARGGLSSKASRHSTYLRQERPTTIVQHSDAGIVEQTEGQAAGPDDIIHLPPSYQEASHTPPTSARLPPN